MIPLTSNQDYIWHWVETADKLAWIICEKRKRFKSSVEQKGIKEAKKRSKKRVGTHSPKAQQFHM